MKLRSLIEPARALGERPVSEIEGPAIRDVLAPIWLAEPETAQRVRQRIGAVLDWSYAKGYRATGAKRLDRIGRILQRLARNDAIALETLALFIRHWLTATPALPEHDAAAARAKGAERYERFVQTLGRRLITQSFANDLAASSSVFNPPAP